MQFIIGMQQGERQQLAFLGPNAATFTRDQVALAFQQGDGCVWVILDVLDAIEISP